MTFWSKVKSLMDKKWKDGKQKIQEKVDRLENTYKGARTQTGKVGNIRVGDRELGEEDEDRGPKSLNFPDGNFQRAKTFRTKCVNRFRDKKARKLFSRQKKGA